MKRNKSFTDKEPVLYLISTPIGNLNEWSQRAIDICNDCDAVAAEDTRNSGLLLHKFNIKKEMFSLREHNENEASDHLIDLLKKGKKVVYMSDAGFPGISDPGNILVKKCLENDIKVSVVSGPSAFINALVCSGLESNHFYFHGFLSPKENEAREELNSLKNKSETLIFYESPHRIKKTLSVLFEVLGDRKITIARELTKINEEFIYSTLDEIQSIDSETLIGEMALVVEGNNKPQELDEKEIVARVDALIKKGLSHKTAVEIASEEFKVGKNLVYSLTKK